MNSKNENQNKRTTSKTITDDRRIEELEKTVVELRKRLDDREAMPPPSLPRYCRLKQGLLEC